MEGTLAVVARLVVATALVGLFPPAGAPARTSAASPQRGASATPSLRVEIQQDGRTVPIKDHAVVIQRKPFDLVFSIAGKDTISVRAASQPALYDLAKSGAPLGKIFKPAQTVAESLFDKDEDMMLDDPTAQNVWWYDSKTKDHRFSEVAPAAGGFRCRRRIANFFVNDATVPIARTDFDAIYVVFITGKGGPDGMSTIEEQRGFVKIAFATPAKGSGAAAGNPIAGANVFSIGIEQLASPVAISAHEARIRKAPFDVLVTFKEVPGVFVHAAFESEVYDQARRGLPLGDVFQKFQTIALGKFNKSQILFINDAQHHQYWYAFARDAHDFTGLFAVGDGFQGRRVIANLWVDKVTVPIHRAPQSVLYLVFYAGDLSEAGETTTAQRAHERQRDFLKISMQ